MFPVLRAGLIALASVGVLLSSPTARSQDTLRAAIVVNDEIVTELELFMRLRLALISSGLQDNDESRARLRPQVIRALIDEQLQMQEARRLNLLIDEAQVQETFAKIAANNGMPPEQLAAALQQAGILPAYLLDQIRAQLTWQLVVLRRLQPQVTVTPEDIDQAMAAIEATKDQPQRLLAEIFLGVDTVSEEAGVREQAQRLYDELRKGANFSALARQFSQSASAANGGDLGWVEQGQLPAEIESALAGIRPGQVTPPIETVGGFYILMLRDTRIAPENQVTVTLKQILFPVQDSRDVKQLERAAIKAIRAAEGITSCEAVQPAAEKAGASSRVDLGTVPTSDLPSNAREVIQGLAIGQPSKPIQTSAGVAVLFLCDRQEGGINRQRVEERLVREQLELLQRRYLRDLRRAATIELRV